MLWTDYFKPPHFEKYPQLNQLFNEATKAAGAAGTKGSTDVAKADELLAKIEDIARSSGRPSRADEAFGDSQSEDHTASCQGPPLYLPRPICPNGQAGRPVRPHRGRRRARRVSAAARWR